MKIHVVAYYNSFGITGFVLPVVILWLGRLSRGVRPIGAVSCEV
jgi:hypothetical protein